MAQDQHIPTSSFLSNKNKRILFVVFAFLLFYLVSFTLDPYSSFWKDYFNRSITEIGAELALSFLFCFLISEISIFIHTRLHKSIPWTQHPKKRLLTEASLNFMVIILLIFTNLLCQFWIHDAGTPLAEPSLEEKRGFFQWLIVSLVISFVIISINTVSYLINNWKNTEMQVSDHQLKEAALKQASIEAELNALKLQLDPHFIFNSLSVLSELILEDQQLGYQYAENFSKVYRFLLLNSRKNVITLEDELKFIHAYIFLIKHRKSDGLHFEINVDPESKKCYLPPLTLQLLIENALKHNKANKQHPLILKIYSENRYTLIVENNVSPIETHLPSTGIGLNNIMRRFDLLSQKEPEILHTSQFFKVMIHLI